MSSLLFLIALTQAAPVAIDDAPRKMSTREIRAYNAPLTRDNPAYIRCKVESETGSLVRAKSVCRTNQEWQRVEDIGNRDARDIVDTANLNGGSRGS